jgi:hypothetical protein
MKSTGEQTVTNLVVLNGEKNEIPLGFFEQRLFT